MRDHAIGAFGATALALDLLVKAAALAALADDGARARLRDRRRRARPRRAARARVVARRARAARGSAPGSRCRGPRPRLPSRSAVAVALRRGRGRRPRARGAARRSSPRARVLFVRWLGGVTGDALGATAELTETLALVTAAILVHVTAPTRLLLIRHAEPSEDARARCYGRTDVALCAAGPRRARAGSRRRSRATDRRGLHEPARRARARPRRRSPRRSASSRSSSTTSASSTSASSTGCRSRRDRRRYPRALGWMEAPDDVVFPGGESVAELRARVLAAVASSAPGTRARRSRSCAHGCRSAPSSPTRWACRPTRSSASARTTVASASSSGSASRPLVRLVNAPSALAGAD